MSNLLNTTGIAGCRYLRRSFCSVTASGPVNSSLQSFISRGIFRILFFCPLSYKPFFEMKFICNYKSWLSKTPAILLHIHVKPSLKHKAYQGTLFACLLVCLSLSLFSLEPSGSCKTELALILFPAMHSAHSSKTIHRKGELGKARQFLKTSNSVIININQPNKI